MWSGAIISKWATVLCCCMSDLASMGHATGLLPYRHNLTHIAAGHCLYPLPSVFPLSIPQSALSGPISSITSQFVSSALGNVHDMLDRPLTHSIFSATTYRSYSCFFLPLEGRGRFQRLLNSGLSLFVSLQR